MKASRASGLSYGTDKEFGYNQEVDSGSEILGSNKQDGSLLISLSLQRVLCIPFNKSNRMDPAASPPSRGHLVLDSSRHHQT